VPDVQLPRGRAVRNAERMRADVFQRRLPCRAVLLRGRDVPMLAELHEHDAVRRA
jgi:hypothetical protein